MKTLNSVVRRWRERYGKLGSQSSARARSRPALEHLEGRTLLSSQAINEFSGLTANALPAGIASGIVAAPGGGLWFTEPGVNQIGMVTTNGTPREFAIPTASSGPQGITLGPDGNLWFTETNANQIGRIAPAETKTLTVMTVPSGATVTTPAPGGTTYHSGDTIPAGTVLPVGTITEFTIGTANSRPSGIATGSDGNLWFTEAATGKIGLMSPSTGFVNDFALKTPGGQPNGITSGPDGNLWFTLPAINKVGSISPTTLVDNEYSINTAAMPQGSLPEAIASGPDGRLWFTEAGSALVGAISPSTFDVTQYPVPSPGGITQGITAGSDGNLWFSEPGTSRLGRITPSGAVTEFETPTAPSQPWGVTTGPDGNVWFTEAGADQVGQVVLAKLIVVTPSTIMTQAGVSSLLTVASFKSAALNPQTGDFTAVIDWGDGTQTTNPTISALGSGAFSVSATKTYTAAGNYQAKVTIHDAAGATATTNSAVTVAFAATGSNITPVEGQPFSGQVASFTDPLTTGQVGQYAATIDWGDGTGSTPGVVIFQGGTAFNVNGSHTYGDEGAYALTVTVNGPSGRVFLANGQAIVADAPLHAVATTAIATVGTAFTGTVATFTDDNPGATIADFHATITWGDGHTSSGTIVPPTAPTRIFSVSGSNLYSTSGQFAVAVTINDVGGMSATANSTVTAAFAASGSNLSPVEGQPFNNSLVASFSDPLTTGQAGQYSATIDWGDNSTSTGTVIFLGGTSFWVTGSHTYADEGPRTITTTVNGPGGRVFVAVGQALVADAPLHSTGMPFAATAGVPFTGLVATFSDENPNATVSDFQALIDWGDGHVSSGTIGAPAGAGYFTVTGSNTYALAGTEQVTVKITDVGGSTTTTGATSITVGNGSSAISGHLVSPNGFTGNVTNVNRPTFQGSASPLAIVQLYALRMGADPSRSIYLGQTISGPDGAWSLTSPLLQDGVYTVTASATAQDGFPTAPIQIVTEASPLIIDTVAPRVSGLRFNQRTGIITVVIQDSESGLYDPTLIDPSNYVIMPRGPLIGGNPRGTNLAPAISGYYSSASSVTLQFQVPISAGHYLFEIKSGGVVDLANNPLDGEFTGRLPSGNGRPGGNFIAQLNLPKHPTAKPHRSRPFRFRSSRHH